MSGSAGGNRIPRESLKKTAEYYINKVLKNFPGFTSAKISGSYNTTSKSDFGDIDLVVSITSDKDKKNVKADLIKHLESLPQDLIVPFKSDKHKGKRTLNHGEIITILFPIIGLEDQFVQIDNIISLSEEEGEFKKSVLDLPAERQGLILGLVKTPLLEEEPEKVFIRMGIKNIEPLEPNQEYEFHINTSGLTLRKVTLDDNFKTLESTDVWKSTDFNDVKKLLSNYNLEGSFEDLMSDIKNLKNPRSKNRVKGWFLKNIRVQAGEKGTPKAAQKQQAIDAVSALEEKYSPLVMSLIKPLLLENTKQTIALMPGAFKPPHRDHLRRINAAAENADQAILLISPKDRAKEGEMPISAEQSIAIWQLYKDKGVLKPNVTFEVVPDFSPVKTAYDIIAANPQNQYIGVYGKGEASRWKSVPNEKYPNATASDFGIIADLSATDLRTALLNGGDITPFLPKGVTPEEYKKALNIEPLSENLNTNNIGYRAGLFTPSEPSERLKDKGIGIVNSKVGLLGTGYYFMGDMEDAKKLKQQLGSTGLSHIDLDAYNLYRPNDPSNFYENLKALTSYLHTLTPQKIRTPEVKENLRDAIDIFSDYLKLDRNKTTQIFKDYLKDVFLRNDGDLLSNRLLANYDGIDLRGTEFDDFGAGSLIFNGKLKKGTYEEISSLDERVYFKPEPHISKDEIEFIDQFADKKLSPLDIDLSGKHFQDRVNDPRNNPEIETYELEDFFDKLADKKVEFLDLLDDSDEVVAKDTETNINIPFKGIKDRAKAIAKTIMRKRNFMTSNPILSLQELKGRSYDQETLEISHIITNQFKANYGYEYDGYDEGKVGEKEYEIDYEFRPKPFEKMKGRLFDIKGEADADTISIKISYNKDIPLNEIFNDLIAELKETIRHELQHIGQFAKYSDIKPNTKLNSKDLVTYFTDPSEVEAHLKGLYRKAKTQRLPLSQVIDDFLDDRMEQLSDQDIETVKKVWDRWIRINLPRVKMNENIEDKSSINELKSLILEFTSFLVTDGMKLHPFPKLKFIDNDVENAKNPLGKTAYYDPQNQCIALYTLNRHPKDILRSYSHELVHHMQNLEGRLKPMTTTNVHEDSDLAEIEKEAHELGSLNLRKWEDKIKN